MRGLASFPDVAFRQRVVEGVAEAGGERCTTPFCGCSQPQRADAGVESDAGTGEGERAASFPDGVTACRLRSLASRLSPGAAGRWDIAPYLT